MPVVTPSGPTPWGQPGPALDAWFAQDPAIRPMGRMAPEIAAPPNPRRLTEPPDRWRQSWPMTPPASMPYGWPLRGLQAAGPFPHLMP